MASNPSRLVTSRPNPFATVCRSSTRPISCRQASSDTIGRKLVTKATTVAARRRPVAARTLALGAAVATGLVGAPLLAQTAECDRATVAAAWSCRQQAQADYFRTFGLCANAGDPARWDVCVKEADSGLKAVQGACRDQERARRKTCQVLGQEPYDPVIRSSDFVAAITNPYFPLRPGTVFVYKGGRTVNTMVVLDKTVTILGVRCVVVKDVRFVDDELKEDEFAYYAQDKEGNVWFFGEVSLSLDQGAVVSSAGSWIAGVDGAKPGIVMPASPEVGATYRQEFALGKAENMARIENLDEAQDTSSGRSSKILKVLEFTPLEPDDKELKFYAPGVGQVLAIDLGSGEQETLVSVKHSQ